MTSTVLSASTGTSSLLADGGALPPTGARRSAVHAICLCLVWLAVASGAVVFSEPAPVDVLTLGVILLLPIVGLVAFKPGLIVFLTLWIVAAAAAVAASAFANDIARSSIHAGISLYLYLGAFVFSGFVAKQPLDHTRLILNAYSWAAVFAACAGLCGYFDIIPGTAELFTKFGRASGPFKDPNVFGPFLVPAFLYCLYLTVARPPARAALPALIMSFLGVAILLSFSRGAWINLAVAVLVFGWFSIVCAPSNRQRFKLVCLTAAGAVITALCIFLALQSDAVGNLLEQRAQLTQAYDEGPEGRFGGHEKAKRLILDNPLGIGAGVFTDVHHHEEVHNVYLSMFLNAGWLGGLLFILMCGLTTLYGFRHGFKRTITQPLFLVAYAAFVGNIVEGVVIDLDHWRHLYLLMAVVWGLMLGDRSIAGTAKSRRKSKIVGPAQKTRRRRLPKIVGPIQRRLGNLPHRAQRRVSLKPQMPASVTVLNFAGFPHASVAGGSEFH